VVCADENVSDVWIEDASIASTYCQLYVESIGLSSCWIQIRNRIHNETVTSEEYLKKMLPISSNIRILSIIAIGFSSESLKPHSYNDLEFDKIHFLK